MTSARGGGWCPKRDNSTYRLRDWDSDSDKGGVKNSKNSVDVICWWFHSMCSTGSVNITPCRKRRETKHQPGRVSCGQQQGCRSISFHFLWGISFTDPVHPIGAPNTYTYIRTPIIPADQIHNCSKFSIFSSVPNGVPAADCKWGRSPGSASIGIVRICLYSVGRISFKNWVPKTLRNRFQWDH